MTGRSHVQFNVYIRGVFNNYAEESCDFSVLVKRVRVDFHVGTEGSSDVWLGVACSIRLYMYVMASYSTILQRQRSSVLIYTIKDLNSVPGHFKQFTWEVKASPAGFFFFVKSCGTCFRRVFYLYSYLFELSFLKYFFGFSLSTDIPPRAASNPLGFPRDFTVIQTMQNLFWRNEFPCVVLR